MSNKGELSDYFSVEASILYYSQRGQTSQKGARGKQIDQNDNVVEIGRLNAIVADLNKKNRQLTTENNKLKKTVATKEGLKENNRQLTEENKKLKKTAATNEAVLAKEKAEKEKLKVHRFPLSGSIVLPTGESYVFRLEHACSMISDSVLIVFFVFHKLFVHHSFF